MILKSLQHQGGPLDVHVAVMIFARGIPLKSAWKVVAAIGASGGSGTGITQ